MLMDGEIKPLVKEYQDLKNRCFNMLVCGDAEWDYTLYQKMKIELNVCAGLVMDLLATRL